MSWTEVNSPFRKEDLEMEELGKKYYKIRDVSEMLGVAQSTLRYWEREFGGIEPSRTLRGQRQYSPSDIETLRIIHYLLKTRGLKMDAAKRQMEINRDNISKRLKVIRELGDVRDELTSMLGVLGKRRIKG